MPQPLDLTGHLYGRLTVLSVWHGERPGSEPGRWWLCRCKCGTERAFPATQLRGQPGKRVQSCGCLCPSVRKRRQPMGPRKKRASTKKIAPLVAGEKLREWRLVAGLTQPQAAARVGITKQCWSQYEASATIKLRTYERLTAAQQESEKMDEPIAILSGGYDQPAVPCPDCSTETVEARGYVPYSRKCPACSTILDVSPGGFVDEGHPEEGFRWLVRRQPGQPAIGPFEAHHSASYPPG